MYDIPSQLFMTEARESYHDFMVLIQRQLHDDDLTRAYLTCERYIGRMDVYYQTLFDLSWLLIGSGYTESRIDDDSHLIDRWDETIRRIRFWIYDHLEVE